MTGFKVLMSFAFHNFVYHAFKIAHGPYIGVVDYVISKWRDG